MSHNANYTDTGPTTAFYQGRDAERERIMKALEPLRPPAACRCESCATAHKFFQLIEAKND